MPRRYLKHPSWRKFAKLNGVPYPRSYRRARARIKAFIGKRRRVRHGGRGRYRRRVRRRFSRRRSSRYRSNKWKDVPSFVPLTRFQVFKAQYGQQCGLVLASALPTCAYFTCESFSGGSTKSTVGTIHLNGFNHLSLLADELWKGPVGSSTGSMGTVLSNDTELTGSTTSITSKLQIKSSCYYTLRSASNEAIDMVMYVCRARGNVTEYALPNIYDTLARGFAINGLDPTHPAATSNVYMQDPNFSPYNSELFTSQFKILKTKRFKINGGKEKKFRLKSRGFYFKPANFFDIYGTNTPNTWSQCNWLYTHFKHEKFILFQMKSRPVGTGAAFIAGYSQNIGSSDDVVEMLTRFTYKARLIQQSKTPSGYLDSNHGFVATAAGPATNIIDEKTHLSLTQGVVT